VLAEDERFFEVKVVFVDLDDVAWCANIVEDIDASAHRDRVAVLANTFKERRGHLMKAIQQTYGRLAKRYFGRRPTVSHQFLGGFVPVVRHFFRFYRSEALPWTAPARALFMSAADRFKNFTALPVETHTMVNQSVCAAIAGGADGGHPLRCRTHRFRLLAEVAECSVVLAVEAKAAADDAPPPRRSEVAPQCSTELSADVYVIPDDVSGAANAPVGDHEYADDWVEMVWRRKYLERFYGGAPSEMRERHFANRTRPAADAFAHCMHGAPNFVFAFAEVDYLKRPWRLRVFLRSFLHHRAQGCTFAVVYAAPGNHESTRSYVHLVVEREFCAGRGYNCGEPLRIVTVLRTTRTEDVRREDLDPVSELLSVAYEESALTQESDLLLPEVVVRCAAACGVSGDSVELLQSFIRTHSPLLGVRYVLFCTVQVAFQEDPFAAIGAWARSPH
jgi:hypothetical protein